MQYYNANTTENIFTAEFGGSEVSFLDLKITIDKNQMITLGYRIDIYLTTFYIIIEIPYMQNELSLTGSLYVYGKTIQEEDIVQLASDLSGRLERREYMTLKRAPCH